MEGKTYQKGDGSLSSDENIAEVKTKVIDEDDELGLTDDEDCYPYSTDHQECITMDDIKSINEVDLYLKFICQLDLDLSTRRQLHFGFLHRMIYYPLLSDKDKQTACDRFVKLFTVLCKIKDMEGAKQFINLCDNVDISNSAGITLLMNAASFEGCTECINLLLAKGAKINKKSLEGNSALTWAAISGCSDYIEMLVEKGAHIDLQNREGETPLISAVSNGKVDCIIELIDRGADINKQRKDGKNALACAVHEGKTEVVKVLIDFGANDGQQADESKGSRKRKGLKAKASAASGRRCLEVPGTGGMIQVIDRSNGVDSLFWAAENGHDKWLKILTKSKSYVNTQSNSGMTPMMLAAYSGHVNCMKVLFENGAKIDAQGKTKGRTALMLASNQGQLQAVKWLLEQGAKVNLKTETGETAIMRASSMGHAEIVQLLGERGAKLGVVETTEGCPPVWFAAAAGHAEVIRVLGKLGADVDQRSYDGETALMRAACTGYHECAKALIEYGAKVNLREFTHGYTVLIFAATHGKTKCAKVLVENGANVNMKDNDSFTPLMYAVYRGYYECMKVLTDNGADPNMTNINGATALMLASQIGSLRCMKELLDKGANVNAQDPRGTTALMLAASNGRRDAVKLLFKYGADLTLANDDGEDAMMYALKMYHFDVVNAIYSEAEQLGLDYCLTHDANGKIIRTDIINNDEHAAGRDKEQNNEVTEENVSVKQTDTFEQKVAESKKANRNKEVETPNIQELNITDDERTFSDEEYEVD